MHFSLQTWSKNMDEAKLYEVEIEANIKHTSRSVIATTIRTFSNLIPQKRKTHPRVS